MSPTSNPQAAPAQPAASPPQLASSLTPSIVDNIPVKAQQVSALNEDDELDKIMRDVGHELKKDDKKPSKKHFSLFKHKAQAPSKPQAAPAPQPLAAQLAPAQPAPTAAAKLAAPKPPKPDSGAAFIISTAAAVTLALIVAAVYAYK